jgi:hypothetical protein
MSFRGEKWHYKLYKTQQQTRQLCPIFSFITEVSEHQILFVCTYAWVMSIFRDFTNFFQANAFTIFFNGLRPLASKSLVAGRW